MASPHQIFDQQETALITLALTAIELVAPDDASVIRTHIRRLGHVRDVIDTTPSLDETWSFAGRQHSRESLLDRLIESDGFTGELRLPVRATMSRTFLVLKIQLLRDFVRAVTRQLDRNEEWTRLDRQLREELAQSIYTELAEALLLSLLSDEELSATTKRKSADQLVSLWDNAKIEIDDFCPLLESAWKARNRVNADLGTMLCTSEYFRLVTAECASDFLDYFCRDNTSSSEEQAFEEFLLDLSFEEIATLRTAMRESSIGAASREWAEEIIGRAIESEVEGDRIEPMTLHRSFFRRQRAADLRRLAKHPGPRRTAEAYMMIYLLDQAD
jgi:hypothetical protein